jgi:HAMP domain-containing protein
MPDNPKPRTSIRGKLNRLVLLSIGTALGIAACLSLWQETNRYIVAKREGLVAAAQVFSAATSKFVAAGDAEAVVQALRAIARVPGLVHAEVDGQDGRILADMGGAIRLAGDLDLDEASRGSALSLLTSRSVQVSVPVVDGGREVGRLTLVSDTSDLFGRFIGVLTAAAVGSALAVVIGLAISMRLQRSITRPLVSLAETMTRIEKNHDYHATIEPAADAETNALASSFNSMIHEIQKASGEMASREEEIIHRLSRAAERRAHRAHGGSVPACGRDARPRQARRRRTPSRRADARRRQDRRA